MVDKWTQPRMTTIEIVWVRLMHKLGFTVQMTPRIGSCVWSDWPDPKWNYHMCLYRVKK